jgi:hypothetical protein
VNKVCKGKAEICTDVGKKDGAGVCQKCVDANCETCAVVKTCTECKSGFKMCPKEQKCVVDSSAASMTIALIAILCMLLY